MKRTLLLSLSLAFLVSSAQASPYFRLLGYDVQKHAPVNFHPNLGAAVDPKAPGDTDVVTLVPLVMHSHADGYLILPGEDWSPLAVGGGDNGGRLSLYVGPLFNLVPAASVGLDRLLSLLPDKYANLKSIVGPAAASSQDAGVSVSPLFKPPLSKSERGSFRIFTGAWLKF